MSKSNMSIKLVGADGFEPPKSKDSRFTVCPIWPLWNTPEKETPCLARFLRSSP